MPHNLNKPPIYTLPEKPLAGVVLDGNSLKMAEITMTQGKIKVLQTGHYEGSMLLERIDALQHPVHNRQNTLTIPDLPLLKKHLHQLLSSLSSDTHLLASLPEDVIRRWREIGPNDKEAEHQRYLKALKRTRHANPHGYPLLIGRHGGELPDGQALTHMWSLRFADFIELAELYNSCQQQFSGAATIQRAFKEILPVVLPNGKGVPQTVVHIGRLRTTYIGILDGIVRFCHTIPVGLARDDRDYFEKLSPNLEEVDRLIQDMGQLLLPADMTPSGLFQKGLKTAQTEATRFAHQVGEFSHRVKTDFWPQFAADTRPKFYLSGSVCNMKGLRQYLQQKSGLKFEFLSNVIGDSIEYDPETLKGCITDYLVPIGNCLAYCNQVKSFGGMILMTQRPKRLAQLSVDDDPLEIGRLHLVEFP